MPNITADVLRAQCEELRRTVEQLTDERDRWREQARALVALLPDTLERARAEGQRIAYGKVISWHQREGSENAGVLACRELAGLTSLMPLVRERP